VATVSHELRTPLASLMGFTETLLGERPGPLTAVQKRFLDHSYQNARRLQLLIEELLTVSRIQQGSFKIYQQPFLPASALENVKAVVAPLATSKAIQLIVEDQWPTDVLILGDQNRLEQVLINLISNAIKFTPTDGTVQVIATQELRGWQVKVQDTGIGIPADEIPKLFTRFTRASNAVAEQVPGTGLGLYVCKAIIEQHGGQIGLTSQEGEGATAWFIVPVA
jgi:signal transduction histidine kinase